MADLREMLEQVFTPHELLVETETDVKLVKIAVSDLMKLAGKENVFIELLYLKALLKC